jgi:ABC-type uncharacterized transport system permease subunit
MSHTRYADDTASCSIPTVTTTGGTVNASAPPPGQATLTAKVTPHRNAYTPSMAPAWHRVAEIFIRVTAMTSIAAIVLIFAFVAKEALPLFFSEHVHKEVTLRKMWTAQAWPGYDSPDYIWQPVSEIPKFGIWPLVIGTLKVSLVSMPVAVVGETMVVLMASGNAAITSASFVDGAGAAGGDFVLNLSAFVVRSRMRSRFAGGTS